MGGTLSPGLALRFMALAPVMRRRAGIPMALRDSPAGRCCAACARAAATAAPPPAAYPQFGRRAYWEEFYRKRAAEGAARHFEWFLSPGRAVELIQDVVGPDGGAGRAALHVGCGTSTLGADLLRADVCGSVTNTDTSATAVAEMARAHGDEGCCTWLADDCTASALPDAAFDLVVDKGTMDALGFGEGGAGRVGRMVLEMHRLLRPGGVLIQFTDEPPERGRAEVLRRGVAWQGTRWRAAREDPEDLFGDDETGGFEYYMYWCNK